MTGSNSDTWTALQSLIGGNISKPITKATTYTLTCLGLANLTKTKTVTINILLSFQERKTPDPLADVDFVRSVAPRNQARATP